MKQTFYQFFAVICLLGLNTSVLASLSEAEKLIRDGKLDAAVGEVNKILLNNADDLETRFLKGIILSAQAKDDEAIKIFAALTIDYPALPEPYNNLGVLFTQQGDYGNARDALLAAIRLRPSYSVAHENIGDLYANIASYFYNRSFEENSHNESARLKQSRLNKLLNVSERQSTREVTKVSSQTAFIVESEENQVINEYEQLLVDDGESMIISAIHSWSSAWSAQDPGTWLSHYSSDFKPSDGLTREEWVVQRRTRLQKPSFIKVTIDQLEVVVKQNATAIAEFVQTYLTDSYSDQVVKVLEMRRENGNWKIYREQSKLLNWRVLQ